MATQKRKKAPAQRKQRRWIIPKILLVVACVMLIAFISAIFLMERELRRVGLFGDPESSSGQPSVTQSLGAEKKVRKRAQSSPSVVEELTQEEKKQLDTILRSREGR